MINTPAVTGEFVGTYIMMTLGLGISVIINYFLYPNGQSRYLTGFYWGISIWIASMIGTGIWNTANFNPLFSIAQGLNQQITWSVVIGEIMVQILATWLASATVHRIWKHWLITLPLNLNFFATVPRRFNHNWYNFFWEAGGTALITINAQLLPLANLPWWVNVTWSSIVMFILITIVAPITGAAFNPTRDLVPREYFSFLISHDYAQWNYAIVPLMGPIVGCGLVMIIKLLI
ncbi:aquaporin [Acetilactobacillus jinshanensis]|uniref:Aquaporin family protein n=1 Tax=Acetilactobacillus jinshanensis TaxID=1720083 RepID=A0A4P6ZJG6_9LACO|nr:aquaporin [Acetilactobacillus jinshanensis]QBP17768.1 hypothetical protein ELX58_00955 [Acetilactobacillus jinshanensis]URL60630.1 hypothetical protein HGK75_00980 [uncultured bacterium]